MVRNPYLLLAAAVVFPATSKGLCRELYPWQMFQAQARGVCAAAPGFEQGACDPACTVGSTAVREEWKDAWLCFWVSNGRANCV